MTLLVAVLGLLVVDSTFEVVGSTLLLTVLGLVVAVLTVEVVI